MDVAIFCVALVALAVFVAAPLYRRPPPTAARPLPSGEPNTHEMTAGFPGTGDASDPAD